MLDSLFSTLAPHYCLSCGEIGRQICDNCFFDIDLALRQTCLKCHGILVDQQCNSCVELAGVVQLVLGEREGVLARLIDEYKFQHKREAHKIIARMLDTYVPHLPAATHVLPIPTASPRVRRRGFDHTRDFVRRFARLRNVTYSPLLSRKHNLSQVGAGIKQRQEQASTAFALKSSSLNADAMYVVCDDIVTTGASVVAAVGLLRQAGANKLAICALVQQPWK